MKLLTRKEKELYNSAIKAATNEIKLYDGLIPDEGDRNYMAERIYERLAYKIKRVDKKSR
ncbi:MAG TPA: hypothetical protein P5136_01655 [Methanofastidiosum sp.]|nr:hypothetical protein [Methanofastidiosum sp.]